MSFHIISPQDNNNINYNEETFLNKNNNLQIEPLKVYIRIRPFINSEIKTLSTKLKHPYYKNSFSSNNLPQSIFQSTIHNITVIDPTINNTRERQYAFDGIFNTTSTTLDVFNSAIKPIIDNLINGYNATALAYGITGTGKTYTIFGNSTNNSTFNEKGITSYACEYLFEQLNNKSHCIKVSYLEIYNETVIDLLNPTKNSLMVIEDNIKGVIVPDLSQYEIKEPNDLVQIIKKGNSRRTMAPTNQNIFSSRSHALLQITLNEKHNDIVYSKLLIVDLAGSERGGIEKGRRREEGANINKSLLSLGNCINILSDKNKIGAFVPYRDSKLTRLLKDSLGRNIQTIMLACVSPSPLSYEESINTLNYAARARKIQKKVVKNLKDSSQIQDGECNQYKEVINALKAEITQLKNVIKIQQEQLSNKNNKNNKKENDINNNNSTCKLLDISSIKGDKPNENKTLVYEEYEKEFILDCNNNNNDNVNDNNSFICNPPSAWDKNSNSKSSFSETIRTITAINPDVYRYYLESYDVNLTSTLTQLEQHIDTLKTQKNLIESFLETQTIPNTSITSKYNQIKTYYDKYISLINNKLIENIEQNMMLKCNLKEINELNETNNINLNVLNKQIKTLKDNKSSKTNIKTLNEEIKKIKNAIKENEKIKEKIYESFARNQSIKNTLKRLLLNLLTNNEKGKNEKYLNVLKEKEKFQERAKIYEKKLQNAIDKQNEQSMQLQNAHKEVEILKKQLKEKDKTINELKQYKTIANNSNNHNEIKYIYINNSNTKREQSSSNIKAKEVSYTNYDDNINSYKTKSLSNIHIVTNKNNKQEKNDIKTPIHKYKHKIEEYKNKLWTKKSVSPFLNKKPRTSSQTNNQSQKQNINYYRFYNLNNLQKINLKTFLCASQPMAVDDELKQNKSSNIVSLPKESSRFPHDSQIHNQNILSGNNSNITNNKNPNYEIISSNLSKSKNTNYSKYINTRTPSTKAITPTNASSKQITSLKQARIANKRKSERSLTPVNLKKAESFIKEYFQIKQNDVTNSKNDNCKNDKLDLEEVISSFESERNSQQEEDEDQVNMCSLSKNRFNNKESKKKDYCDISNSNNYNRYSQKDDIFNSISLELAYNK